MIAMTFARRLFPVQLWRFEQVKRHRNSPQIGTTNGEMIAPRACARSGSFKWEVNHTSLKISALAFSISCEVGVFETSGTRGPYQGRETLPYPRCIQAAS